MDMQSKETLEALPFRPGEADRKPAWRKKLSESKRKRDADKKNRQINLAHESWWESQGLDGEQTKARKIDRWTLSRMAFEGGINSDIRPARKGKG